MTKVKFPYFSFRNITGPEDNQNDRRVLTGQAPITSFLELNSNENVREYLLAAKGRERNRPRDVHRSILDTLKNKPDNFSVLNGGITIVADDVIVYEKEKSAELVNPSIINGSQTQGIIKDFCANLSKNKEEIPVIHASFEIIVTTDKSLIAEISIARNLQNAVQALSIAGSLGQLDDLDRELQKAFPDRELKKSETDLSDQFLPTERIIQVLVALTPDELWVDPKKAKPNKVKAYTSKARCLKDFQNVYKIVTGESSPPKSIAKKKYADLYQFYLDIVVEAYLLHEKWKTHQGWNGSRIKSKGIQRDEKGSIKEVADGIMFPILASFSTFARKKEDGKWTVSPPESFPEDDLIQTAKQVYIEIAKSDPPTMGKNQACYSALKQVTNMFKRYAKID